MRGRGSLGPGVRCRPRHGQAPSAWAAHLRAAEAHPPGDEVTALRDTRHGDLPSCPRPPRSFSPGPFSEEDGRPGPEAPACPRWRGGGWAPWRPAAVTYSPRGAQRHGPQSAMPGGVNPVPPIRELGGPGGRRRQREDRMRRQEPRELRPGRAGGGRCRGGALAAEREAGLGWRGPTVAAAFSAARVAWPPRTLTPRTEPKPSPQERGDDGGRPDARGLPALGPAGTRGPAAQAQDSGWSPWRGRLARTALRPGGLAAGARTRVVGRPQLTIPTGQRQMKVWEWGGTWAAASGPPVQLGPFDP